MLVSVIVLFFFTPEQPVRAYLSYFIMISTVVLFFTMPVKLSQNVETVGRATLWAIIVNSIVNSISGKNKR